MSKKLSESQKEWQKVFKLAVDVSKEKRAKNKNLTHQVAMQRAWKDSRVMSAKKKYENQQKKRRDAKKKAVTKSSKPKKPSTRKKVVKKKVVKKSNGKPVRRVKKTSTSKSKSSK